MFCRECGSQIEGAKFCPNCGAAQAQPQPSAEITLPPPEQELPPITTNEKDRYKAARERDKLRKAMILSGELPPDPPKPTQPRVALRPPQTGNTMVCPHCQASGTVTTKQVKMKAGVSGGKATGALLTGGVSLLATGLSRKQKVTRAHCKRCGSDWTIS